MKYLFFLAIFFLPAVFYAATPVNVRALKPANVAEVPVFEKQIVIAPPAPVFIKPSSTFIKTKAVKLSFKEKMLVKLLKFKMRRFGLDDDIDPRKVKLGKISLIAGAAAFAFAIVPFLNLLSIPLALTALITGIISLRGNQNIYGIIGLCLGSLFLLIVALAVVIIIALLA